MSYLIQLADNIETADEESIQSIRFLRMFCAHRRFFDENEAVYIHYIIAVGYEGGNCQGDYLYKVSETNLEYDEVRIAIPSGDCFFMKHFVNDQISDCNEEMTAIDVKMQNELISEMNQYLIYDDLSDFFYYNTACNTLSTSNFSCSAEFPLALLKRLCATFWPFSVSW